MGKWNILKIWNLNPLFFFIILFPWAPVGTLLSYRRFSPLDELSALLLPISYWACGLGVGPNRIIDLFWIQAKK